MRLVLPAVIAVHSGVLLGRLLWWEQTGSGGRARLERILATLLGER